MSDRPSALWPPHPTVDVLLECGVKWAPRQGTVFLIGHEADGGDTWVNVARVDMDIGAGAHPTIYTARCLCAHDAGRDTAVVEYQIVDALAELLVHWCIPPERVDEMVGVLLLKALDVQGD